MGEIQLDLLERILGRIVGLRNVLAHLYAEIDIDRLYVAMREDRHLLREFGRIAARELRSEDR